MMKYVFNFAIGLLLTLHVCAIPARQVPITITQPNGKTLTYIIKGDEVMSWAETMDGYTLLRNHEGVLCYAFHDMEGNLTASDVIACNAEERNVEELLYLNKTEKRLFFGEKQLKEFDRRRKAMFNHGSSVD